MNKFEVQHMLFDDIPKRMSLQSIKFDYTPKNHNKVNVWRNHAIETIVELMQPYLAYGSWIVDFVLSDYDDTLTFDHIENADLEVVWLDSSRYLASMTIDEWLAWLKSRIAILRHSSKAPIIVATWCVSDNDVFALQTAVENLPACYLADLRAVCEQAGVPLLDTRSMALSGTPLNSLCHAILARELSCRWMPACLFPPIKAIAVDLDNTLHKGVLGEDGYKGVCIESGHIRFQRQLIELRNRGIFLALVSRNEMNDVKALFKIRQDYPIRWEDFSVTEVSWGDKSTAILRIANTLRIGIDAILYVDDNSGELYDVTTRLSDVHAILADSDAEFTSRILSYYPALWRWTVNNDDAKRVHDFEANAERNRFLAESSNSGDYFRSLSVKLIISVDPLEQLKRLSELCSKTNQFNLSLRRFNEAEIDDMLSCRDACVVSVALSDKLADSGVIAVIVAVRDEQVLSIEELCISCRALGRKLEDTIIMMSIRAMPQFEGCKEVVFRLSHGPRNQPAQDWLAQCLSYETKPLPGKHTLSSSFVKDFIISPDLILQTS